MMALMQPLCVYTMPQKFLIIRQSKLEVSNSSHISRYKRLNLHGVSRYELLNPSQYLTQYFNLDSQIELTFLYIFRHFSALKSENKSTIKKVTLTVGSYHILMVLVSYDVLLKVLFDFGLSAFGTQPMHNANDACLSMMR